MTGARTTWLPASLRKTSFSAASSSGAISAGPIKKDKLFFFLDWERSRQDYAAPVQLGGHFAGAFQLDQSAFQGTRCVWPNGLAGD